MNHDLRMVPAAVAVWSAAAILVKGGATTAPMTAVAATALALILGRWQQARPVTIALVCLCAIAVSCGWRLTTVESSPLAALAEQRRTVTMDVEVVRDARTFSSFGRSSLIVEVLVRRVAATGIDLRLRARATAFIGGDGDDLVVGRRFVLKGRLAPADESQQAAVINVTRRGPADRAAWWWEGSEHVREGVRQSVAHLRPEPRALLPALVDGDDSRVSESVEEDFRRSGLTHLMAVSGTNLTIVLGVVMVLARAAGLGRRWLLLAGALSIVAFVLLARPDPSVLRAAAMGAVGVAALGFGMRGGVRALAWAVIALLFVDPWLARMPGFVLSVVATAGILLLTPAIAGRLRQWLPNWCALVIAVPLAAQLACTPVLAALSGEVSLVAVFANVLAGPAVAPATVAGLLGGLVAVVWVPAGQVIGTFAGACTSWILTVGHRAAALDAASLQWHAPWQVLLVAVPIATWLIVRISARPVAFVGLAIGLMVAIWRPPQQGWPPTGWVMVACDVGQGDATVLNAGDGVAVVIDAGPEPALIDGCLDRLRVDRIALVVLTHAHADHVEGLSGIRRGRPIDQFLIGPSAPTFRGGDAVHVGQAGERFTVGAVTGQIVWPPAGTRSPNPNEASIVLRVDVGGIKILLSGDIEPEGQEALLRSGADVAADVLKMPHHGSGRQSERFFAAVGPRLVTISAGEGNDYGHPAAAALHLLQRHAIPWRRTDTDGDIAIVIRDGELRTVTR